MQGRLRTLRENDKDVAKKKKRRVKMRRKMVEKLWSKTRKVQMRMRTKLWTLLSSRIRWVLRKRMSLAAL
jgi:hypothetical protein